MRKSFFISLFMFVCFLLYFITKQTLWFYQNNKSFFDPDVLKNEMIQSNRLERCDFYYNKNLPSFVLRNNLDILCSRNSHDFITVGIVLQGKILSSYIQHLLDLGKYYCEFENVHFEYFLIDQMDYFENHNIYPPHIKGWLLFGSHFELSPWKGIGRQYGRIGLGSENCANGWSPREVQNAPSFGFLTYGDCNIIDNVRFFILPLGPLFEGNRDFPFYQSSPIPIHERQYEINAEFTITPEKPSRAECLLEAQLLCTKYSLKCSLGMDWTYFLPAALKNENSYFEKLQNTKFVLCPSGNNYEQYRIYEAILAGAIPIIEDGSKKLSFENYTSPAYGNDFYCLSSETHYLLKSTNAPVIFIEQWSDLHIVLKSMEGHEQEYQNRMIRWRESFFLHFKLLIIELIIKHFNH